MPLGYQFQPGQASDLKKNLNTNTGGLSPMANQAVKILSLRLPNVLGGGRPIAPDALLKPQVGGTGGSPGSVVSSLMRQSGAGAPEAGAGASADPGGGAGGADMPAPPSYSALGPSGGGPLGVTSSPFSRASDTGAGVLPQLAQDALSGGGSPTPNFTPAFGDSNNPGAPPGTRPMGTPPAPAPPPVAGPGGPGFFKGVPTGQSFQDFFNSFMNNG